MCLPTLPSIYLSIFFVIKSRLHPHLPIANKKPSCLIITITRPYIQIIERNEQLQYLKIYVAINIIYTHILRVEFVLLLYLPITEQNNHHGCQLQFQIEI